MMESKYKWVRLGDYIEARNERNSDLRYGVELIEGINSNGEFQKTKAVTDGIDMKPYKAVWKGDIAYNPSRLNIGSLAFREEEMCIVSHLYQVFHVKEEYKNVLLPEYLLIYFKRKEFSRIVDYYNYGSQRAEFNLKKLGELEIPLPALSEQQKIVNAWKALREIKEQNEAIAAPLMQVCQSYIQELKHKYESVEIGPYIEECNERNSDLKFGESQLRGVTSKGIFDKSKAKTEGLKFGNYKNVYKNNFAYNPSRINLGSIALCNLNNCIISPMYVVFKITENGKNKLNENYLNLWFRRTEFQRSTLFFAAGSVRDTFDFNAMQKVRIPLPPLSVQKAIVNIYNCANEAKKIAAEADRMSREVCPALIQHATNHNI